MRQRVIEATAAMFAAMGHPTRLRILAMLHRGEHDATELARALGLTSSNTSQHLALLRAQHLVSARRQGTHVQYALRDARIGQLLEQVLDLLAEDAAHGPEMERAIRLVRRGRL